jgi:uncharacterized protein YbaR (Trm112 family)
VSLEAPLLKILACPIDKGELLYFDDEDVLYNPRLHRLYRVARGVPVMLATQSEAVSGDEHGRLMRRAEQGWAVSTMRARTTESLSANGELGNGRTRARHQIANRRASYAGNATACALDRDRITGAMSGHECRPQAWPEE